MSNDLPPPYAPHAEENERLIQQHPVSTTTAVTFVPAHPPPPSCINGERKEELVFDVASGELRALVPVTYQTLGNVGSNVQGRTSQLAARGKPVMTNIAKSGFFSAFKKAEPKNS
jgi:hypothetical protein